MASSAPDYFSQSRPAGRPRQPSNLNPAGAAGTPGSPRTPLPARSISAQFASPGTPFRSEQEDLVVYELGARHLSAGFAGESRPRCILPFTPADGRRAGDYRSAGAASERRRKKPRGEEDWGAEHELYRTDMRSLDLGLVEDKLERAVRKAHADFLQLPNKSWKAVLALPSLLPTPLVEIALQVLFNHYAQPPSVVILTTPILACVGAGLRHALVVEMGWEETVATAVGEYKEVCQRRSVRAGKMLTRAMAKLLGAEVKNQQEAVGAEIGEGDEVSFAYAEDVTRRMAWCRPRDKPSTPSSNEAKLIKLPHPNATKTSSKTINVFFNRLSEPAESTLLSPPTPATDDHETPLPRLMYSVLLALPTDLRALCLSRITFTGGLSSLPGLKHRLLQEVTHLVETRGWDPVRSYGSAEKHHARVLAERSANVAAYRKQQQDATTKPAPSPEEPVPTHARPHDDENDAFTNRAERQAGLRPRHVIQGVVRGVQTLGPWVGASLVASLRVKGVHEVEREEFLRHGVRSVETL